MTWESLLQPNLSQEQFAECVVELQFADQGQEAVFRTIYKDLQNSYAEAAALIRRQNEQLEEAARSSEPGPKREEAYRNMSELITKWRAERQQLELKFEADVRASLDDSHQAKWDHITRQIRRHEAMAELKRRHDKRRAVDLIECVESLQLDAAPAQRASAVLRQYELDLDQRLRQFQERASMLEVQMWVVNQLIWQRQTNDEPAPELQERATKLSAEARSLIDSAMETNWSYVPLIAGEFEAPHRAAFLEAVHRRAYPELFKPCPIEMAVEALQQVEGVSPPQRQALEQIWNEYQPARNEIRFKIIDAIERWDSPRIRSEREEALAPLYAQRELGGDEWLKQIDEINQQHFANEFLPQRYHLALETCRRLRALFTDQQFAALPLRVRLLLMD